MCIRDRPTPKLLKTLHIGPGRAMRPEIMSPNSTDIWIVVTRNNGVQYSIEGRKMTSHHGGPGEPNSSPWWEEDKGVFSTLWWYHQPWGIVGRQYKDHGPIKYIWVARHRPRHGGPCITSMAQAAGSMWVTLAPVSSDGICKRS